MYERHNKILSILSQFHRLEVSRLARLLQVSSVTVRKDLRILKNQELINREHGFVFERDNKDGVDLSRRYALKRRIAEAAASTVANNEIVMIGGGSTCALLAEELIRSKSNLTILTNSVFLVNHLKPSSSRVILLGGYYHHDVQVMVGPLVYQTAEMFAPCKFFISADGFSNVSGFTGVDYLYAQTIRDLARKAGQISMLFDSGKFFETGTIKMFSIKEIDALYTDDQIPIDKENYLLSGGRVSIHKVSSNFL